MSGPQFMHLQSNSRKANPRGQSVEQVLDEAARAPVHSKHVVEPQPSSVVYGVAANEVRKLHNNKVAAGGIDVTLKDGRKARRGIRKVRHTLMTAVASHPLPTELVNTKPDVRADYEIWREHNIAWLKTCFGEKLVSVIEHWDEERHNCTLTYCRLAIRLVRRSSSTPLGRRRKRRWKSRVLRVMMTKPR